MNLCWLSRRVDEAPVDARDARHRDEHEDRDNEVDGRWHTFFAKANASRVVLTSTGPHL